VLPIQLPSLREIPEDVPLLADYLLGKQCRLMGVDQKSLTPGGRRCLSLYDWPGNVRELENELRRVIVSVRRKTIGEEDLSDRIRNASKEKSFSFVRRGGSLKENVERLEIQMISEALRRFQGNQVRAAKGLGLSRQGLIKKVKRYGISV